MNGWDWLIAALLIVEVVCAVRNRVDEACGLGLLVNGISFIQGPWPFTLSNIISAAFISMIWRWSYQRRARQVRAAREREML